MNPEQALHDLQAAMAGCSRCGLCQNRRHIVFGKGNPQARIMLVGEGPGGEEDARGIPFVGKAGRLLDKIIAAAGLPPEDIYICNVVKCRPPGNRLPTEEETAACKPFLREQIRIVRPALIVALGALASQTLLNDSGFRISKGRGQWRQGGIFPILPTYHPAALLRDEGKKRPVWKDFLQVATKYNSIISANYKQNEDKGGL